MYAYDTSQILELDDILQAKNGVHTVNNSWRLTNFYAPAAVLDCVLIEDARIGKISNDDVFF